jgi:hypothetical protein
MTFFPVGRLPSSYLSIRSFSVQWQSRPALLAAPWREYSYAVSVQFSMKTNLRSTVLIAAAAGVVAAGYIYVSRLESRTRLLEARLARVETALNGEKATAALAVKQPAGPAQSHAAPAFQIRTVLPPAGQQDSLEARAERIEQELTPHVELIPLARPENPAIDR